LTSYLDTLTPDTQDAVLRVKGPTGHVSDTETELRG
jgi:hypothetical protein